MAKKGKNSKGAQEEDVLSRQPAGEAIPLAKKAKEAKSSQDANISFRRPDVDGEEDVEHDSFHQPDEDGEEGSMRNPSNEDEAGSDSSTFSGSESESWTDKESDDGYLSVKSHASKAGLISTKDVAEKISFDEGCEHGVRQNAPKVPADAPPLLGQHPPVPRFNKAPPIAPGSIDAILNVCGGAPGNGKPNLDIGSKHQQKLFGEDNAANINSNPGSIQKPISGPHVWTKNVPSEFCAITEPEESYTVDGTINMDDSEAAEIKADYEHALVGRVVSANFRFEWLSSQLHAKWGTFEGFQVKDLGQGCFLLQFANRENRDAVWLGGPWHIAGKVVGLDRWTAQFIPSKNPRILAPTWVRIPGLPLQFWGEKNLKRIAVAIGEPVYIDAFTKTRSRTSYARICVRRNLAAPLLGGVWLNSQETGKFFQKLSYEGMDPVCATCGFTGHDAESCKPKDDAKEANGIDPKRMGLDGWTCIQPKKPPKPPKPGQIINNNKKQKPPPKDQTLAAPQYAKAKQKIPNVPQEIQSSNPFNSLPIGDDVPDYLLMPITSKQPLDPPINGISTFHPGESSSLSSRKKSIKDVPDPETSDVDDAKSEGNVVPKLNKKKKSKEDYLADVDEIKRVPPTPRRLRERSLYAGETPTGKKGKTPQRQLGANFDKAGGTPSRQ